MPEFDRQRAADVLVDAHVLGTAAAAEKWSITTRTIRNHQARLLADTELAQLFAAKLKVAERAWQAERIRFLRNGLAKLDKLVAKATSPKDIDSVARAVKVVGELQVASDVLNGDRDADSADPLAAAAARTTPPGTEPH